MFSEHVFLVAAGFSLRKLKLAATFKTLIYYIFTEHLHSWYNIFSENFRGMVRTV